MTFGEFFVRAFGWAVQEIALWLTVITGVGFVVIGVILVALALCSR